MNEETKLSIGQSRLNLGKKLPIKATAVVESVSNYEHMKMMTVADYMRFFNSPYVSVYFHSQGNYVLASDQPGKLPIYGENPNSKYDTTKGVIFYTRYHDNPRIQEQRFVSLSETCLVNTGTAFRTDL
jgi:hypothetical protein